MVLVGPPRVALGFANVFHESTNRTSMVMLGPPWTITIRLFHASS